MTVTNEPYGAVQGGARAQSGRAPGDGCRGKKGADSQLLVPCAHNSGLNLPAPIFFAGSKTRAEKLAADRAKVKAWAAANPEKKRERDRRWREAKQERERPVREAARAARREASRERAKAAARARYCAVREVSLERSKAWREANPDRMRKLLRAWKVANPEKVRDAKRGRDRKSTARHRARLMKLQRGKCAYCRERLDDTCHVDHVIPRAAGGSNRRSNLQLTCAPCNLSKGARDPIAFAQTTGRLL